MQVQLKLEFENGLSNTAGRIWVFFSQYKGVKVVESDQFLAIKLVHPFYPKEVLAVFVHASCDVEERRQLWRELQQILETGLPAIVYGDFNVVISEEENKGGRPFELKEALDFLNFVNVVSLTDVGFSGNAFTWTNNRRGAARIYKRLDRVMVEENWLALKLRTTVEHLNRVGSDHAPLLVKLSVDQHSPVKAFRFLNFWTKHESFRHEVQQSWRLEFSASPMYVLANKLKRAKQALWVWSREQFGDVFEGVRRAEEELRVLEQQLEEDCSDEKMGKMNEAKAKHMLLVNAEEEFLETKSQGKMVKRRRGKHSFFPFECKREEGKVMYT